MTKPTQPLNPTDRQDSKPSWSEQIAELYLQQHPREWCYPVTISSYDEDQGVYTLCHPFDEETLSILRKCQHWADLEKTPLGEVLVEEGHQNLVNQLLEHDTFFHLDRVDKADLEHPSQFTEFSYIKKYSDGDMSRSLSVLVPLTDEEFKILLAEHLEHSNHISVNMLVYRYPEIAQHIIHHIAFASEDFITEDYDPFMCEMDEFREIAISILNPSKDILNLFGTDDKSLKSFLDRHQIISDETKES